MVFVSNGLISGSTHKQFARAVHARTFNTRRTIKTIDSSLRGVPSASKRLSHQLRKAAASKPTNHPPVILNVRCRKLCQFKFHFHFHQPPATGFWWPKMDWKSTSRPSRENPWTLTRTRRTIPSCCWAAKRRREADPSSPLRLAKTVNGESSSRTWKRNRSKRLSRKSWTTWRP
jgi:hypothetical protein